MRRLPVCEVLGLFLAVISSGLFYVYLLIYIYYGLLFLFCLFFPEKREEEKIKSPSISIIIPCYNEALIIVSTIRSLLEQDYYENFEIVIVDDGSTDETADVLKEAFGMHPYESSLHSDEVIGCYRSVSSHVTITLIRKRNGGKAASLNLGIRASQFPIFHMHGCGLHPEERCFETDRCTA